MTKLYFEILDKPRQDVFALLAAFGDSWTLAGGTALALQVGHRKSYDFDLFSPHPIPRTQYRAVCDIFGQTPVKLVDSNDQLTVAIAGSVELTFLYYWFPRQFPVISTNGITISDLRDIAADKAMTLGRRNMWRDYVDLYVVLCQQFLTIADLIRIASKKFGNEFSPKLFLQELCFTEDIRDRSLMWVGKRVSDEEVCAYLEHEATAYAKQVMKLA